MINNFIEWLSPSFYRPYLLADFYRGLEVSVVVVGLIVLVSSIDDLFIDLWYWMRELRRNVGKKRKYAPLTAEQVRSRVEQPLAIMVPAWLEFDVIAPMLENMVATLEYKNYITSVPTLGTDLVEQDNPITR